MNRKSQERTPRSPCPVACTLDLIGDRWTLLVIRDLMLGKKYFQEFLESPEGIATNILTKRLEWLQEKNLMEKMQDPDDRRKSIYCLTEEGEKLRPLLKFVAKWGLANLPGTKVSDRAKKQLRS